MLDVLPRQGSVHLRGLHRLLYRELVTLRALLLGHLGRRRRAELTILHAKLASAEVWAFAKANGLLGQRS